MNFNYKNYYSVEDLRKRGYNLKAEDVLDDSHFDNIDDAIDDFMDDTFRNIYNLFVQYKGRKIADAFFTDMARDDLTGIAKDIKERLNRCLVEQAIFIYDNGDANAQSGYQERSDRTSYAPKAMAEIMDVITRL